MMIFLNEEKAYASWLTRHRDGFVVDWRRHPTRSQPQVHRADCQLIRGTGKKSHCTTGRRLKACALDLDELRKWTAPLHATLVDCQQCSPFSVEPKIDGSGFPRPSASEPRKLTRLGREVIDYVIEVALIHLDQAEHDGASRYDVNIRDIARCLGKTPAQLVAACMRLFQDGLLRGERAEASRTAVLRGQRVFPTGKALRSLPAYANVAEQDLEMELNRLVTVRGK